MRALLISLVLCFALAALSGCGQKGKLYRTGPQAAVQQNSLTG